MEIKIFPGTQQLHLPTVALNICISASEQINDINVCIWILGVAWSQRAGHHYMNTNKENSSLFYICIVWHPCK